MTEKRDTNDGYTDFTDMLTAYRKTHVLLCAHELGIFQSLAVKAHTAEEICVTTGMDKAYGRRFLETLVHLGFLEKEREDYSLSRFSRRYLIKGTRFYQRESLEFEKTLIQSWQNLHKTLIQGKRIFNAKEKSKDEYHASLAVYLKSMDNAARIRAEELWPRINASGKGGLILDAGAGSGAFLQSFLTRNPSWTGIFCDLPDVIALARKNQDLMPLQDRIAFIPQNLLEKADLEIHLKADILLCSNLVHCQGREETKSILSRLAPHVSPDGCLIIHDFFTDQGSHGALYDLHMMLNTYNGRTYTIDQIKAMAAPLGFTHHRLLPLTSSSLAIVCSKKAMPADFFPS